MRALGLAVLAAGVALAGGAAPAAAVSFLDAPFAAETPVELVKNKGSKKGGGKHRKSAQKQKNHSQKKRGDGNRGNDHRHGGTRDIVVVDRGPHGRPYYDYDDGPDVGDVIVGAAVVGATAAIVNEIVSDDETTTTTTTTTE